MDPCDIIDSMNMQEMRMALRATRTELNCYQEEYNFAMDQLMHYKNKSIELKKDLDLYKGLCRSWQKEQINILANIMQNWNK